MLASELSLASNREHQEMVRQKSLALIHQASASALNQQTKKQNENLKAEVKLLQERLVALNELMEKLIASELKDKIPEASRGNDAEIIKMKQKYHELEEQCHYYQEELKVKKNLMA